jgi:hypothetical protein
LPVRFERFHLEVTPDVATAPRVTWTGVNLKPWGNNPLPLESSRETWRESSSFYWSVYLRRRINTGSGLLPIPSAITSLRSIVLEPTRLYRRRTSGLGGSLFYRWSH